MESNGVIDGALLDSKSAIHSHLVDAIKELQVIYKDTTHSSTIGTDQDSTILLNALEALFVHGLKDSHAGWSIKSKSSLVSKEVIVIYYWPKYLTGIPVVEFLPKTPALSSALTALESSIYWSPDFDTNVNLR